jgi:hypothetical protein
VRPPTAEQVAALPEYAEAFAAANEGALARLVDRLAEVDVSRSSGAHLISLSAYRGSAPSERAAAPGAPARELVAKQRAETPSGSG